MDLSRPGWPRGVGDRKADGRQAAQELLEDGGLAGPGGGGDDKEMAAAHDGTSSGPWSARGWKRWVKVSVCTEERMT